jgi:thiamine pyrophosphate-dependent acetolactate synthase large subunit-like protein
MDRGTMKYSEALAQALTRHDLRVMFGVLGDANMHLGNAFTRQPTPGRFVTCAHEAGAVLMAAGYAAVSGKVGLATVTHGAITNSVGALFEATRGGYPLLLLAGDTARVDTGNLQNLPHRDIVVPTGAGFVDARAPETVLVDLERALHDAITHRRPVVLNVPSDFQLAECEPQPYRVPSLAAASIRPDREVMEEVAATVIGSSRPVILAGRGAAGSGQALRALAERIGAPVATTLRGKGLFAGDPFELGICGTLASPPATTAIVNSDCLLAFGASLSPLTTLKGELLAGKRVVQVDSDPAALGRLSPIDIGVVGGIAESAQALIEILDEAEAPPAHYRSAELQRALTQWRAEDRVERGGAGGLDIRDALYRADAVVPSRRSLVIDAGRFAHEALRIMTVDHPSLYVHALNVAQIGMSLSYGIGSSFGGPDWPAVVVIGDGGFMLGGMTEFNTAVRNGSDLIVFVMNDGAYGAEYYRFVAQEMDTSLTTFAWPDLAEVARSLGGVGLTVRELADFDQVEKEIAHRERPILVEVHLDKDAIPDPGAH